jgi:hypothetical protein
MRSTIRAVASALTIVLAVAGLAAARAGPPQTSPPLQSITATELTKARLRGTGCSWSLGSERASRLVFRDDRALVKLAGRLVFLEPGAGARDLFPFTFDRWRRGDLGIVIRKLGPARRIGTETLGSRTDLVLVRGGRRTVLHGAMECGS